MKNLFQMTKGQNKQKTYATMRGANGAETVIANSKKDAAQKLGVTVKQVYIY